MNTLELAARNLLRNRRRSLLTLMAIVTGTMAALLFGGYVADTVHGLQTATVRAHGHLQIVPQDYLDFGRGNPGRFSIRNYDALIAQIRNDPELAPRLAVVTPVLDVEGVAGNFAAGVSSSFVGEGVVPAERRKQLAWDGFGIGIHPAQTVLADDDPDGGVIGLRMAQLLDLCDALKLSDCRRLASTPAAAPDAIPQDLASLGSRTPTVASSAAIASDSLVPVELLAATPGGLPNVVRMNVLQAERQGIRQIDSMYVAMPLRLAQRLVFGPDRQAVTSIVVQLRRTSDLSPAKARLEALVRETGESLEVLTFHDVSPVYNQIVATYDTIFQFIAVLIAVITLFSITNAINMAVSERVGEIGTLRSLGFQRSAIRRIFIAEGALLGFVGAVAGAVLASVLAEGVINPLAIGWTPPGRTQPIPIRVDILASYGLLAGSVTALTVIACLSALWPADKAARLEVSEALRHA